MFKRVALFLATNLAVLALVSVVLSLLNAAGVDLGNNGTLLVFAALFGFGGSLLSLAISKWVAKRMTGMHVIEQPRSEAEAWLLAT
ncbi:MAG TPA: protease HtpX, partial [Arenimonas sp.]|nr:protease HtpX [Arenimonas sp.]